MRTYFDSRGRRIFTADQERYLTTWTFDGADRLIRHRTPLGNTTTFGYNPAHFLTSVTNPAGHIRTIEPDAEMRPWKVRNFEGQETVLTYNSQHKLESSVAPGGVVATFEYDSRGRLWKGHPASYAAGQIDTYAYDTFGHVDKITHPADANTGDQDFDDYSYSARGDLLEVIDRKDVRTTYAYNGRRQLKTMTQWEGAIARTSETFYDDAGDVDYTLDASGRKVDSEHDALGALTQMKRGPISSQVAVLTQVYDNRHLLQTSTDALNHATTFTHSARQLLRTVKDASDHTVTYGYDSDGQRVTTATPLNFVTTTIYDSRGYRDGVEEPREAPSDPARLIDYTYDKDGRMTALANRLNKSFTWSHNDATRTISSKTPTNKTTTTISDARGLLASIQEPSTQTTTYAAYDAEGRLTQKVDGVGTTAYTYWPNGMLKESSENGRTSYREYDALNRLSLYQDGEGNTLGYTYYPGGELKTITYPGSPAKVVTYTYDDFGRLRTVTDWAGRVSTYTYDNASRMTVLQRPNGTRRELGYTDDDRLWRVTERAAGGGVIWFTQLTRDADGRVTDRFLRPATVPFTLPIDGMTFNDDNQIATFGAAAVVHDSDGNMTGGPDANGTSASYVYDTRNRLLSAGGLTYRYSVDGQRVAVTNGGQSANYAVNPNAALSQVLVRTRGGVSTYYVYGAELLYEESSGATTTYHYDELGSTVALTSGDGNTVTDRVQYAPFGQITSRTGSTDTDFLYHGALGVMRDANALYYMRARYYNPRIMRFLNADPIGFAGGSNWYAFANSNPVMLSDPNGLTPITTSLLGIGGPGMYGWAANSEGMISAHVAAQNVGFAGNISSAAADAQFTHDIRQMGKGVLAGYTAAGAIVAVPALAAGVAKTYVAAGAVTNYLAQGGSAATVVSGPASVEVGAALVGSAAKQVATQAVNAGLRIQAMVAANVPKALPLTASLIIGQVKSPQGSKVGPLWAELIGSDPSRFLVGAGIYLNSTAPTDVELTNTDRK